MGVGDIKGDWIEICLKKGIWFVCEKNCVLGFWGLEGGGGGVNSKLKLFRVNFFWNNEMVFIRSSFNPKKIINLLKKKTNALPTPIVVFEIVCKFFISLGNVKSLFNLSF